MVAPGSAEWSGGVGPELSSIRPAQVSLGISSHNPSDWRTLEHTSTPDQNGSSGPGSVTPGTPVMREGEGKRTTSLRYINGDQMSECLL